MIKTGAPMGAPVRIGAMPNLTKLERSLKV